jgi:hypothetical protein
MFRLDPAPTFLATVQISVPGADSRPLRVHFKHQPSSVIKQFLSNQIGKTDAEALALMVDHVDESEKAPGQLDADFLERLFEAYPAAKADMLNTFLRELTESRVKN